MNGRVVAIQISVGWNDRFMRRVEIRITEQTCRNPGKHVSFHAFRRAEYCRAGHVTWGQNEFNINGALLVGSFATKSKCFDNIIDARPIKNYSAHACPNEWNFPRVFFSFVLVLLKCWQNLHISSVSIARSKRISQCEQKKKRHDVCIWFAHCVTRIYSKHVLNACVTIESRHQFVHPNPLPQRKVINEINENRTNLLQ